MIQNPFLESINRLAGDFAWKRCLNTMCHSSIFQVPSLLNTIVILSYPIAVVFPCTINLESTTSIFEQVFILSVISEITSSFNSIMYINCHLTTDIHILEMLRR